MSVVTDFSEDGQIKSHQADSGDLENVFSLSLPSATPKSGRTEIPWLNQHKFI